MRKLLLLLMFFSTVVYGQTNPPDYITTPNLGLKLAKVGSTNWGTYVNQNFVTIDQAVGAFHGGWVTVPFSTTPVFNMTLGNTFQLTLSGNVTSSTVNQPGITQGQLMYMVICQNATGGFSFTFPATFQAPLPTINGAANSCSASTWVWNGIHWINTGGGGGGGGGGGIVPPSGDIGGSTAFPTVTSTHLASPLAINQGGTGTITPSLVQGTNVVISGLWPNQTISCPTCGGGGGNPAGPTNSLQKNNSGAFGASSIIDNGTLVSTTLPISTPGLTDTSITGITQCLHATPAGLITGTGSDCGSGGGGGGNTTSTALSTNTLSKATGPNSIVSSSITDNGTNVFTSEPLSAAGLTATGISGSTQCIHASSTGVLSGAGSDCSVNPPNSTANQYVSSTGNDSRDGLSWATSKATPYAALLALPGGSVSPPTAGYGVVHISSDPINGIPFGGPLAPNGGWYMFGPTDPNYAGGLSGWMRAPLNGLSVTLQCDVPTIAGVGSFSYGCLEFWGGAADNVHPAVWLSGFASQAILRGMHFNYEARGILVGIDSNNNRSNNARGTTGLLLEDDAVGLGNCYSGIGAGPAVDIGGSSFLVKFVRGSYTGCIAQDYTISAISRTSNVVTVTLNKSGTGDIVAGASNKIIIRNVVDQTFNGAYAIASASGTSVTYAQNGPNASSSGGQAFPYGAAAIGLNAGTAGGVGAVYLDDVSLSSGGVWAQGGFNGVGISINKLFYESSGNPDMATVEYLPPTAAGNVAGYFNDIQYNDQVNPVCGVENLSLGNVSAQNTSVCGSASAFNAGLIDLKTSALRQGMAGVVNGGVVGASDAGRRMFSPYSVGFFNNIGPNTTWTPGGITQTNGILDPDRTTGASRLNNTTGSQNTVLFGQYGTGPNLGDTYPFGMWLRVVSGPAPTISFAMSGAGNFCNGAYYGSALQPTTGVTIPTFAGDGQWSWYAGSCKVVTNPTGGGVQSLSLIMPNTTVAEVYGPVLTLVPSGTISDNEIAQMVNTLQSYSNAVITAGDVSTMDEQRLNTITLALRNPRPTAGYVSAVSATTLTANRVVTIPDATLTVAGINITQTWSANQTFSNGTELRFLSSNATNYAGFKGGASTTNLVWLFPTTDSSGTQCLSSNGSLQLSWSACSAGTGTPGGASSNVQYNNAASFAGSGNFTFDGTGLVGIGLANTTLGKLKLFGSTSGDVTIQPQAVAGTATVLTAPNTTGTIADGATTPIVLSTTTGNLTCPTCSTNAAALIANQLTIGSGGQAQAALGTLGTTTTVLHGNAGGAPTFGSVSMSADVTGTLAIANGGTGNTAAAAAFDALAPTTTRGDVIVRGASSNTRLGIGGNGSCLVSNGTDPAWGSCAAGAISGTAVNTQGTFWTGTNTVGGSANWTYSATSGHSMTQGANNVDMFYGKRFTDSAPTGNFFHFQNNAANADVATLDVNGNLTIASIIFNGSGPSGTLNLFQGTAPALIANTVQLTAPSSVAAGGIQFKYPGNPSSGFIRWTNSAGTETGALTTASGVGACAVGTYVTTLNDNTVPTCSPLAAPGFGSQTANTFIAAPNGSAGPPTFRAILNADLPAIVLTSGVTGILPFANGGTNATSASAAFNNLSPMTTAGDIIYGGVSGAGTRLAPGSATQLLHSGSTPSWSAVSLTADVTGLLPIANGGTGQTTAGAGFNALAPAASANAFMYATGTNTWGQLAAGGAGTLCITETGGGTPVWGSCGGGGGSAWSGLTAPGADLSLSMGTFNSLFTHGIMVGTRNAWEITDGASTSTGSLFNLHTNTSSTMKPLTVTAAGTANGVQMDTVGNLGVIGTGNITATKLSRTITTTTPLTIGGGASADLTADRTLACPTCVTSASALTNNAMVIGSGGGQGTATDANITSTGNGNLTISNTAIGTIPLTINAIVGQTANLGLFQVNSVTKASISTGGIITAIGGFSVPGPPAGGVAAYNATNSAAATVSVPSQPPTITQMGKYWDGAASQTDTWTFSPLLTAGTNGNSTFSFVHTGSTGFASLLAPNYVAGTQNGTGGNGLITVNGSSAAGATPGELTLNGTGASPGSFTLFPTTAGTTLNVGSTAATVDTTGNITGRTLTSTVATGTAPLTVTSTTNVANLNASTLAGINLGTPVAGGIGYGASTTQVGTTSAGTAKQIVLSGGTNAPTMITFPDTKYAPAADCVNSTAGSGWSTGATPAALCRAGTNNKGGLLSPWGASDVGYIQFHIPADADLTTQLPSLMLEVTTTESSTHTIIMQESVSCAKEDGSTTDDVAFNAARSFATVTETTRANQVFNTTITLNSTDLTGCTAPGIMNVKISRTTDTATNVGVYGLNLTMYRLLTVQAN